MGVFVEVSLSLCGGAREWSTSWVTNQTSVNLRKLKSCQAFFLTTMMRLDINYEDKELRTN